MFLQAVASIVAVTLAAMFLQSSNPPWIVYAVIAGAAGWGAAWLRARMKYGRGINVVPSVPEHWRHDR